jgi:hypothetical protein
MKSGKKRKQRSILCHETGVCPTSYGIFAQGKNSGTGETVVAVQRPRERRIYQTRFEAAAR